MRVGTHLVVPVCVAMETEREGAADAWLLHSILQCLGRTRAVQAVTCWIDTVREFQNTQHFIDDNYSINNSLYFPWTNTSPELTPCTPSSDYGISYEPSLFLLDNLVQLSGSISRPWSIGDHQILMLSSPTFLPVCLLVTPTFNELLVCFEQ